METYFLISKSNRELKEPLDEYCKLPIIDDVSCMRGDRKVIGMDNSKLSKICVIDKRSTETTTSKRRRSRKYKLRNANTTICAII